MDVAFSVELVKKKAWPHSSVMRASTVAGEFDIVEYEVAYVSDSSFTVIAKVKRDYLPKEAK